ncbi:MAG: hypothetical protein Q4D42_03845 [Eubacteriales bacterium]|nr:hypothetical protein [Eubacteriales bacterium]
MEPVPLCSGEVILTLEEPSLAMSVNWDRCPASSFVVPDAMSLAAVRSHAGGRPVGMMIHADGWNPEEDIGAEWPSERLIGRFKNIVSRATHAKADFVYIRMRQNLHVLRAAVLAVTDQSGLGILVEMPVDEDGRTGDGSSALAVMGIMQRIGVAGIILTGEPEDVDDVIEELAPYANIALGVSAQPHELDKMQHLESVEFYHTSDWECVRRIWERAPESTGRNEPEADEDYILAPVGAHTHFVDATIDISDPIDLEDNFGENLLELEDQWSGAWKLEISTPYDVHLLAENQYMLERPVCLEAENPELLEEALRVFDGIALYDGTWELDEDMFDYFRQHYGLVAL